MGVFTETLKEYERGSGEKFKVQEGKNVIRILSEPRMVQSVYQGQPNTKFVAWVIDRADGKIKLYYMLKTIPEAISALRGRRAVRIYETADAVRHHHQRLERRHQGR